MSFAVHCKIYLLLLVLDCFGLETMENHLTLHDKTYSSRHKRSAYLLYKMVTCSTTCSPAILKGYGCHCGINVIPGQVVDAVDLCCKKHDVCYSQAPCQKFTYYFVPYSWSCHKGKPICSPHPKDFRSCGHKLCECDREFIACLKKQPCPRSKALCPTSVLMSMQNIVGGIVAGVGVHRKIN